MHGQLCRRCVAVTRSNGIPVGHNGDDAITMPIADTVLYNRESLVTAWNALDFGGDARYNGVRNLEADYFFANPGSDTGNAMKNMLQLCVHAIDMRPEWERMDGQDGTPDQIFSTFGRFCQNVRTAGYDAVNSGLA